MKLLSVSALALALAAPATAFAGPITFDFGLLAPNGESWNRGLVNWGTNALSYTSGGFSLGALAFAAANYLPATLSQRGDLGGTEDGLGVYSGHHSSTDREIDKFETVTIDYTAILAAGGSLVSVAIGSLQDGEGYEVFGSNTLPTSFADGLAGSLIQEGIGGCSNSGISNSQASVSLAQAQYKYVTITAWQSGSAPAGCSQSVGQNDMAIGTTVVNVPDHVPEPAAVALLGSGLFGVLAARRKRKA